MRELERRFLPSLESRIVSRLRVELGRDLERFRRRSAREALAMDGLDMIPGGKAVKLAWRFAEVVRGI